MKDIGRRALLLLLAVVGPVMAQDSSLPDYAGFDHLALEVTDLERSRSFYARLFGFEAWQARTGEEQFLVLGATYLRLHEGERPRVTQLGVGIQNFMTAALQHYLGREELRWREGDNAQTLSVEDGDGVVTLLLGDKSWERVREDAVMVQTEDSPAAIFTPLRLDEVGLSVTNLEVDSLFYARLFGRNSTLQAGSLWYTFGSSRLRLTQTPVGQHAGVSYFSILIANTDLEAAANAVFAAGGIIETLLPNGFSFWDPDGLRVVVHTTVMF